MTPRFSLKHIVTTGGIGIVLLCLALLTPAAQTTAIHDETAIVDTPKSEGTSGRLKSLVFFFQKGDFQDSDFYRTIINNNIFRPLGWRPSRPREPYYLIGTVLPTDRKTGAKPSLKKHRQHDIHRHARGYTRHRHHHHRHPSQASNP